MIKKSFQFYKIISLFPFPFILAPTLATLRWIELIWFSLEKEKYVVIQLNHFSGNKLNHNQILFQKFSHGFGHEVGLGVGRVVVHGVSHVVGQGGPSPPQPCPSQVWFGAFIPGNDKDWVFANQAYLQMTLCVTHQMTDQRAVLIPMSTTMISTFASHKNSLLIFFFQYRFLRL